MLTDHLYIRIGDQTAIPVVQLPSGLSLKLTSDTFTLTPEFAYRVYAGKILSADALAGFRYYHLDGGINLNVGQVGQVSYSGSNNWADAIGGARFQLKFTPKIGAFLIGDAGGGGSSPSWQLAFGGGYKLTKRATMQLGYRRLYFNRRDGASFGLDATQQGLILGATLHFR